MMVRLLDTQTGKCKFGHTTADCATGYLGRAVPGTCQIDGTWTDFTGCTLAGKKL